MVNRFKYRAFHKPSKKMLEVYSFCDSYVKIQTRFGKNPLCDKYPIEEFEPLQQFLGIDGKNWWEGDILRYKVEDTRIIIVWDKELACFGLHYNSHDADIIVRLDYFHLRECVKIGNIYENPDLLKNKLYAIR